jgi:hypothetical protein
MKRFIFIFVIITGFLLFSQENFKDIENLEFIAVDASTISDKFDLKETEQKFNVAYSPILPAGGIYVLTDPESGKEANIQIGVTKVNESPYNLYLPKYLYNFFSDAYKDGTADIKLKLKFMGWYKDGKESSYFDLESYIVKPEDALKEITALGKEKYYLQVGAYNYYQNAYPVILDIISYLKTTPKFYMLEKSIVKEGVNAQIFRVLTGPYDNELARIVMNDINNTKKAKVFIVSGESVIRENGVGEK